MKKRQIRALTVLLAVTLLFSMTACQKKAVSISIDDLANELHDAKIFEDELTEVSNKVALSSYEIEEADVKNAKVYFSTGATAEEIAVIECSDNAAVRVEGALNKRISSQKEDFTDYNPSELTKLDAAVVESRGNYAVLCVCKDSSKAKEIIKKYLP